jgi:hypothetical protein
VGGWPGICEDDLCVDDGVPFSDAPEGVRRNILQHQLKSPTCPTDLVYITLEYPENTGSPTLDARLATEMAQKFRAARTEALELSCNDFDGCEGGCLPVGIESHYYLQSPSSRYLSLFRVERFIGNFRRGRHHRGTVRYSFHNYDLRDGRELALKDLFADGARSTPLFWEEVAAKLRESGNCPPARMLIGDRPAGAKLLPGDLLLSRQGATIALWNGSDRACAATAVDLPAARLVAIGANPGLWETP